MKLTGADHGADSHDALNWREHNGLNRPTQQRANERWIEP
jgi:hypothetical protein